MAALRQSIEKAREAAPKPTPASKPAVAPKAKKAVKRNPDQREILLPIAGGGPTKEVAEKQPAKASARKKARRASAPSVGFPGPSRGLLVTTLTARSLRRVVF